MKKAVIVILSILLAIFFTGCGIYTPESGGGHFSGPNGGNNNNKNPGNDDPIDDPIEDDETGYTFTVTLANAPNTIPEDMEAIWTNKREVHSAKFVDGVATVKGLNGDYHVTLSKLPKVGTTEYTYNRNAYEANNSKRDITIILIELQKIRGNYYGPWDTQNEKDGKNLKDLKWYRINKYGTYRATINSADDAMCFAFEPSENGSFYITSLCDISANEINPVLKVYNGSTAGIVVFKEEVTDGSASSTFTKNFRYFTGFGDENIGAVQFFAIRAGVNGIEYPVTVDFTLSREGGYQLEDTDGEPVYATGPYANADQQNPTGSWQYIYWDNTRNVGGVTNYIQDETKVVYNKDDGFYHVGTVDGPLLYAKLTKDCEIIETEPGDGFAFNRTFCMDGLSLVWPDKNGVYYDYSYMINAGYTSYCTSDGNGAHPVNEEIKNFLQGYASKEMLFKDGEGWAETGENPGALHLQSDENSMWLFACGYYRK